MDNPALLISVLALSFTVASFWWMNWRRGKLHVSNPRTCAFYSADAKMMLELPLVFFNDGPMPMIVRNLRVIFPEETEPRPLDFVATVRRLGKDEDRAFGTPFPVRGREALLQTCEFQRSPNELMLVAKRYTVDLEAQIGFDKKWRRVCRFVIHPSEQILQQIRERFLVYDNIIE